MYSYVLYCTLIICCSRVLSIEVPDHLFDEHILECASKLNVDKRLINQNLDESFHLPKGNDKLNQYIECIMKSHGMLLEDGTIVRDILDKDTANILLTVMNKNGDKNEIAKKIGDECINTAGNDLHDRLINLHNCLVDNANKY
ncbi:hypothetical protein FQR65_LT07253 [Abscondita terminalis]|nr:hypothetical protein FQR65_LT07253 [Abscondita terminalis]